MKKLMTIVATVAFVAVFALNVQVSFDSKGKTSDVTTQDLMVQKVLAGENWCGCGGTDCGNNRSKVNDWDCCLKAGGSGNNLKCY